MTRQPRVGVVIATRNRSERLAVTPLIADHEHLIARLPVRRGHGFAPDGRMVGRGPAANRPRRPPPDRFFPHG